MIVVNTEIMSEVRYAWAKILIANLKKIDPTDFDFHSSRYDSGRSFQSLITLAHESDCITETILEETIEGIAQDCEEDGSAYGVIPCLGGIAREIWENCLEWVSVTREGEE